MSLSTHILDTATGLPAPQVRVLLLGVGVTDEAAAGIIEEALTDTDGRYRFSTDLPEGMYVLRFETRAYYAAQGVEGLYPWIDITFTVSSDGPSHLHIPLLLSPFGFTTYRGS